MSLIRSTKLRTDATEIMDDFSISGKILRNTLNTLAHINKWLGGNKVTLNGLKKVINKKKETPVESNPGEGLLTKNY